MKRLGATLSVLLLSFLFAFTFACGGGGKTEPQKEEEQESAPQEEIIEEVEIMSGFTKNSKTNDYYIYTKNGLSAFNSFLNGEARYFGNSTVHLKADITFLDEWIPLTLVNSQNDNLIFDGEGHTIEGLYLNKATRPVKDDDNKPVGFFGDVETNLTVKNVTFKGARLLTGVTHAKWAGIVIGYHVKSALVIEGVTATGCSILATATGSKKIGGIVGFSSYQNSSGGYSLKISDCAVTACRFSGEYSVAGISGTILGYYALMTEGSTVKVENCSVTGCEITASRIDVLKSKDPAGAFVVDETTEKQSENQDVALFTAHGCTENDNEIIKNYK